MSAVNWEDVLSAADAPEATRPRLTIVKTPGSHITRIRDLLASLTSVVPNLGAESYASTTIGQSASEYHRKRGVTAETAATRGVYSGGPGTENTALPDLGEIWPSGDKEVRWPSDHAENADKVGWTALPQRDAYGDVVGWQVRWDSEIKVPTYRTDDLGKPVRVDIPLERDDQHQCNDANGEQITYRPHKCFDQSQMERQSTSDSPHRCWTSKGEPIDYVPRTHQCRDEKGALRSTSVPEFRMVKFSFPSGIERRLDTLHLGDADDVEVILMTEGTTKGDALADAIQDSRVGVIATPGVDAATVGSGNLANETGMPQVAWSLIQEIPDLSGKTFIYVTDGDALGNRGVAAAMSRLGLAITAKGGHFGVVVTPTTARYRVTDSLTGASVWQDKDLGAKAGIDDWLAAHYAFGQTPDLPRLLAEYLTIDEWKTWTHPYSRDDYGRSQRMAEELVRRHSKMVEGEHWWWNGLHYERDVDKSVLRRIAKDVANRDYRVNGDVTRVNKDGSVTVVKEVRSARCIADMTALAVAEKRLAAKPEDFDKQIMDIPFPNGMLDTRTWTLKPLDPAWMNTYVLAHPYHPEARAPRFMQFIQETCSFTNDAGEVVRDRSVEKMLQQQLGSTLPRRTYEMFVVWQGVGMDGKSTLMLAYRNAVGKGTITGQMSADALSGENRNQFTLAKTRGRLALFMTEPKESAVLDDGFVKTLSSHDEITSQDKHKDEREHTPTHCAFLLTNPWPRLALSASSINERKGFWRRVQTVTFRNPIKDESDPRFNPNLNTQLAEEAEGIMAWLVEGLRMFLDNGSRVEIAAAAAAAKAAWQGDTDQMTQFRDDALRPRNSDDMPVNLNATMLVEAYRQHCIENNRKPLGKNNFLKAMKDPSRLGEPTRPDKTKPWVWTGWVLTEEFAKHQRADLY